MFSRAILLCGFLLAMIGVILGAFGAHFLEDQLPQWFEDAPRRLENWKTGVFYQLIHAIGLVGLGVSSSLMCSRWRAVAAVVLLVGVILFSGGLYTWVLTDQKIFVLIVPIGGVAFVVGWLTAMVGIVFGKKCDSPGSANGT